MLFQDGWIPQTSLHSVMASSAVDHRYRILRRVFDKPWTLLYLWQSSAKEVWVCISEHLPENSFFVASSVTFLSTISSMVFVVVTLLKRSFATYSRKLQLWRYVVHLFSSICSMPAVHIWMGWVNVAAKSRLVSHCPSVVIHLFPKSTAESTKWSFCAK